MCYSGLCLYENHMGDCRVKDFKKIQELTGYYACYIGGKPETIEEYEEFKESKEEIGAYRKIVEGAKLVWSY